MEVTDFKIGDKIRIKKSPNFWASEFSLNCPIRKDIYPYVCTIKQLKKESHYYAMTCGKYGWDLDCLIKDGLIEKITNNSDKNTNEEKQYSLLSEIW